LGFIALRATLAHVTLNPASSVYKQIDIAVSHDYQYKLIDDVKEQLFARGGLYQLRLFLIGPAGEELTSAIKAAEQSAPRWPVFLCY
jgi:hypothetical protein